MSNAGGNLFGTRVIWMRIVAIAVIFTAWSQIISCNAANESKDKAAHNISMATSEGAINYCKSSLRQSEGDRAQFRITDSEAVRRSSQQNAFDVTLSYSYLDTYANTTRRDTYDCAVRYSTDGWGMKKYGT